jgi:hypothetical protein
MSVVQPRELFFTFLELSGWLIFNKLDKNSNTNLKDLHRILDFIKDGYVYNNKSLQSIMKQGTDKLARNAIDYHENELGVSFKGMIEGFVQCPEFISNYIGPKAQLIFSKIVIGDFNKNQYTLEAGK